MREIGQCIYCGSTDQLTDEHYFPLSLGGKDVLRDASCLDCAKKINSRIESKVLGTHLANFRRNLGLPSRRNKKAKGKPEIYHDIFGRQFKVPAKDALTAALIYELSTAGVLSGRLPMFDDRAFRLASIDARDDEEMEAFSKKYPLWNKQLMICPRPDLFAALVAKILHGAFINAFGVGEVVFFLPHAIIGDLSPLQLVGSVKRSEAHTTEHGIAYHGVCLERHYALVIADYDLFQGRHDFMYQAVIGIAELSYMNSQGETKILSGNDTTSTKGIVDHLRTLGLSVPF